MSYQLAKSVAFGSGKAGLSTVGYTLLNYDGTVNTARSTSGVVALGAGQYAARITFPDAFQGFVKWDTGEGVPAYASEEVNPQTGENVDVKVSTRSSHTAADVWAVTTRTLSAGVDLSANALAAIWDRLTSAITTAGSIGKLIKDNLDAAVSSRSTYAGGDTNGTTTLLSRLTAGRASNLDSLDAPVSSRLAASSYTAPPTAVDVRAEIDASSTKLDASVSSRLAASSYTAPDNAGVAAVKVQTDKLTFNGSNEVAASEATLQGRLTAGRAGKIDNLDAPVSSRSVHSAADVWAVGTRTLTSFGSLLADVASAVWAHAGRTLSSFSFVVETQPNAVELAIQVKTDDVEAALGTLDERTEQMGVTLAAVKAKTDPLGAGAVTVQSPVSPDGKLVTMVTGDDYMAADGRQLDLEFKNAPDLTDATVKFTATYYEQPFVLTAQVLPPDDDVQRVRFEVAGSVTQALPEGVMRGDVEAVLPSGRTVTLMFLRIQLLADYSRPAPPEAP